MGICALVGASDFNEADFRARFEAGCFDCVVAADGGLASLQAAACQPDYVVGDFDSLGYVPEGANVERHPVRKDASDLELALDYAAGRGFDDMVVYGALGGRLDHTVANLQMCARFAEGGVVVELVGLEEDVVIFAGPATLELPAVETGTVSVFSAVPLAQGVSERGLSYLLAGAALSNRTTLGLSNELIGRPASVSVEEGALFVFVPTGLPGKRVVRGRA